MSCGPSGSYTSASILMSVPGDAVGGVMIMPCSTGIVLTVMFFSGSAACVSGCAQSLSVVWLQPGGQYRSSSVHCVVWKFMHVFGLPSHLSMVAGFWSSQSLSFLHWSLSVAAHCMPLHWNPGGHPQSLQQLR